MICIEEINNYFTHKSKLLANQLNMKDNGMEKICQHQDKKLEIMNRYNFVSYILINTF